MTTALLETTAAATESSWILMLVQLLPILLVLFLVIIVPLAVFVILFTHIGRKK